MEINIVGGCIGVFDFKVVKIFVFKVVINGVRIGCSTSHQFNKWSRQRKGQDSG